VHRLDNVIVLHSLPEEYKEKWLTMTPGGRFCDPYELKGVRPGIRQVEMMWLTTYAGVCLLGVERVCLHDRSRYCDRRRLHTDLSFVVYS
jgi:hypothetical protein